MIRVAILCYAMVLTYGLADRWFQSPWVSDDTLQQGYLFAHAFGPKVFTDDLPSQVMRGYLGTLHYWLGFSLAWLTHDLALTAHLITLIQLVVTLGALFYAVRRWSGSIPAWFAVFWYLHSELLMQRMGGGLPRGWAPAILAAYLAARAARSSPFALFVIACGCLLNPPAAFLAAVAHGIQLGVRTVRGLGDEGIAREWKVYLLAAPFLVLLTFFQVHRPASIGPMASYHEAAQLPEFRRDGGRFPYVPLRPIWDEVQRVGFQAFGGTEPLIRGLAPYRSTLVLLLTGLFLLVSYRRKVVLIPIEVGALGVAAVGTYLLSRICAFYLYVPDRHLQFPLGIFWIVFGCVSIHRLLGENYRRSKISYYSGFIALMAILFISGGSGLEGNGGWNFSLLSRGGVFEWIRANTPTEAVVGGDPNFIDPVQFVALRRGYITNETAHPFYRQYRKVVKERLRRSFLAHYAQSGEEFVDAIGDQQVDYFAFQLSKLKGDNIPRARYYAPFAPLVGRLSSRKSESYFAARLFHDAQYAPCVMYHDSKTVLVDVRKTQEVVSAARSRAAMMDLGKGLNDETVANTTIDRP